MRLNTEPLRIQGAIQSKVQPRAWTKQYESSFYPQHHAIHVHVAVV